VAAQDALSYAREAQLLADPDTYEPLWQLPSGPYHPSLLDAFNLCDVMVCLVRELCRTVARQLLLAVPALRTLWDRLRNHHEYADTRKTAPCSPYETHRLAAMAEACQDLLQFVTQSTGLRHVGDLRQLHEAELGSISLATHMMVRKYTRGDAGYDFSSSLSPSLSPSPPSEPEQDEQPPAPPAMLAEPAAAHQAHALNALAAVHPAEPPAHPARLAADDYVVLEGGRLRVATPEEAAQVHARNSGVPHTLAVVRSGSGPVLSDSPRSDLGSETEDAPVVPAAVELYTGYKAPEVCILRAYKDRVPPPGTFVSNKGTELHKDGTVSPQVARSATAEALINLPRMVIDPALKPMFLDRVHEYVPLAVAARVEHLQLARSMEAALPAQMHAAAAVHGGIETTKGLAEATHVQAKSVAAAGVRLDKLEAKLSSMMDVLRGKFMAKGRVSNPPDGLSDLADHYVAVAELAATCLVLGYAYGPHCRPDEPAPAPSPMPGRKVQAYLQTSASCHPCQ
jgi:hypothetical protein